jgi:hypothetical protein
MPGKWTLAGGTYAHWFKLQVAIVTRCPISVCDKREGLVECVQSVCEKLHSERLLRIHDGAVPETLTRLKLTRGCPCGAGMCLCQANPN